jgi:hemolysin III
METFFLFREPVNAWTHGMWMLLCIPAGMMLQMQARRSLTKHIGFAVFTISLICCFAGSWLYHAVRLSPESIDLCARLDYMGIFILIAGTTTPVVLVALRGWWRVTILTGIWLMAATGILVRAINIPLPGEVSTGLYILMGWTGLISYVELARHLSHRTIRPLWIGGILYSFGAVINEAHWFNFVPGVFGSHEIFHIFVMVASVFHFLFMWRVIARFEVRRAAEQRVRQVRRAVEQVPA